LEQATALSARTATVRMIRKVFMGTLLWMYID
jgi:hypothetical protein